MHDKHPYARKWKYIKWSTGVLSLYLDARLRKRRKRRPLDIVIIDALMGHCLTKPSTRPFSQADRVAYLATTAQTIYWHGTGRLQHNQQHEITDVLIQLLKQRGLRPFKDVFDVKQGEMTSTSVARQRMYARIYADMHAYKGADLRRLYGSPRFWAYYFIMAINLHAIKELGLWSPKARKKQQTIWREQGQKLWAVKVTKEEGTSLGKFFNDGSDLAGNYPIIVGLKQAHYQLIKTAGYVARYESRIGSPISLDAFTHLEVPASKVNDVIQLLKKHGHKDLPVFAMEQCEQLYARKNFSDIVS